MSTVVNIVLFFLGARREGFPGDPAPDDSLVLGRLVHLLVSGKRLPCLMKRVEKQNQSKGSRPTPF